MNTKAFKEIILSDARALRWVQLIVYVSIILYFGRQVLVPVSFALLVSFILYPFCVWLEKRGLGRFIAILIPTMVLMMIGMLVLTLLIFQIIGFLDEWPSIQSKFLQAVSGISEQLNSLGMSTADFQKMSTFSGSNVLDLLSSVVTASTLSVVLLILIPVYSFLILYYRRHWVKVLEHVLPQERSESLREMITLTINAYYNFIKGMAIVYMVVGILNSAGLLLLGVPHAILFGFIAAILTCVPYVGIMVGALLPMTMAWITYDSIWYPLGVVAVFAFVQYLEANIIFPVAVSNRLNVNTFVMLIAIFSGGVLWGMAGMILFVPFVGIAKLIADHNPNWKTLALILGTDGRK
jgi:predicted PurR-regulated permease PerM